MSTQFKRADDIKPGDRIGTGDKAPTVTSTKPNGPVLTVITMDDGEETTLTNDKPIMVQGEDV